MLGKRGHFTIDIEKLETSIALIKEPELFTVILKPHQALNPPVSETFLCAVCQNVVWEP